MPNPQNTNTLAIPPVLLSLIAGAIGGIAVILGCITIPQVQSLLPQNTNTLSNETTVTEITAMDVSNVVEKINPAVVSIIITKDVPIMEQYFTDPFGGLSGNNSPFRSSIPQYRQNGTEEKEIGGGSGFFISSDGYVVTNGHVVEDEDASYTVFTNDETSYEATVIAIDEDLDIAVLKIDAIEIPYLEFGNSEEIKLGQAVIAIGNALGEFRNTVSTGVVSGLSRSIMAGTSYSNIESLENVIQTDAAINPGNSGGPLLNLSGQVIGVNVAVAMNSENIGFSLPSNAVKESVESIIEHGRVIRAYIGVRYTQVTTELQKNNNLTVDYGALVVRGTDPTELAVIPGSPADKAGIEEYDIILEIDGQKIDIEHQLSDIVHDKKPGDTIEVKLLHDGEEQTKQIKLEESPN